MKINGIEVQGIRRVHIEYVLGNAEKVWNRIEFTERCGFYWKCTIDTGSVQCDVDLIVNDEMILDLIRFVFKHWMSSAWIKGDTVYIKTARRDGLVWQWENFYDRWKFH